MSPLIPVTTLPINRERALLDLLPEGEPLSWVRNGEGLVGWGIYARRTVRGVDRFRIAREWWRQQCETFAISDPINSTGTGPILFASFSFDPEEESHLIIPSVVVGARGAKSWLTWIGEQEAPILQASATELISPQYSWQDGTLPATQWQEQVAVALTAIQGGEAEKIVLARDLIATADGAIDARLILQNLAQEYPKTWSFSVAGLVGATPELLLRLNRGMVTSRVLAGTIIKTGDDEKDLTLAASLARSSKDLEEHSYAVKSVADVLATFCPSTNVPDSPFVLHLANVMHLATDVTGAIDNTSDRIDAFAILEKLHPSAAVCGTPTDIAARIIGELEGMSRGRYAGPIGWIDAEGDGEIGIALRCGEISGEQIRLFAGCGIVSESNPAKELAESQAKFLPMINALQKN